MTDEAVSLAYADAMGQLDRPPRATPADAFRAAQAVVHAGERLDMARLAAELGIGRATLYRWTGDRERLLADIHWADVSALLAYLLHRHRARGLRRIQRVAGDFLAAVAASTSLQAFLRLEGAGGFELLTSPRGPLRPRLVAAFAAAIADEVAAGYRAPAPPALLADGIVSLGERFLYNAGDPELNPDPATARTVIGLLLRERQVNGG